MIVIDLETSGVHFDRHGIIAIGAVNFDNPSHEFFGEAHLPDGIHVEQEALDVNGYRLDDIRNPNWRPPIETLLLQFEEWLLQQPGDRTMGGQNTQFDDNFLKYWYIKRMQRLYPLGYRIVDLHTVAYEYYRRSAVQIPVNKRNGSDINADTIYSLVGLPPEARPHNALTGARYEVEAFHRFWFGRPFYSFWMEYPVVARFRA